MWHQISVSSHREKFLKQCSQSFDTTTQSKVLQDCGVSSILCHSFSDNPYICSKFLEIAGGKELSVFLRR